MARATVATQPVDRAGLTLALAQPPSDGDSIASGRVMLWVENGNASTVTVTIVTPATAAGLNVDDLAVSIPAGQRRLIGPLPASVFGRPVTGTDPGRVWVNYSAVTGVQRAVVSL